MELLVLFDRLKGKCYHIAFQTIARLLKKRGTVYMFHNVGIDNSSFNISTLAFERFLRKIENKNVIRLEQWSCSEKFIALSFDDVPHSFYINAFPLLKKYNIPFTLFVSCSLLDTNEFISSNNLLEILSSGLCTLGSHGYKHVFFKSLKREEIECDLLSSKQKLQELTDCNVELFAFPYGSYYACGYKYKNLVRSHYKFGFGTVSCDITRPFIFHNYFIPRVCVTEKLIDKL